MNEQEFDTNNPFDESFNLFSNPDEVSVEAETNEKITEVVVPLINSYTPSVVNKAVIIAQVSPAKFDSLVKTLSFLVTDKSGNIFIDKSQIIQTYEDGSVVCIDAKSIFDGKEIDFHILQPKKYIRQLKQFRGNNDIFIIDDQIGKRFIVDHGVLKVFLPKSDEEYTLVSIPNYNGSTVIDTVKINKDDRNSIISLASGEGSAELLIKDNKLKGIYVKDIGQYTFEPYINEPEISQLSTLADLTLRTTTLLPIGADEYTMQIIKLTNDSYVLLTELDTGLVKVQIHESVQSTSDVNFEL